MSDRGREKIVRFAGLRHKNACMDDLSPAESLAAYFDMVDFGLAIEKGGARTLEEEYWRGAKSGSSRRNRHRGGGRSDS